MNENIHIELLGEFIIVTGDRRIDGAISKSKKGVALVKYLLMNHGERVSNMHLLEALWPEDQFSNPENALKTLVSRLRTLLNQAADGLGGAIVADRGGYRWESPDGVTIDLYQLEDALAESAKLRSAGREKEVGDVSELILKIYKGDLFDGSDQYPWALPRAVNLHNQYLESIYSYIGLLKKKEEYENIARVCRTALEMDAFDDQLHIELMNALTKSGRSNEALLQYKHVTNLHYRYLGVQPPEAIQEFYKQIMQAGKTLEFSLDSIRGELREHGEVSGAFVCEYAVFKEIFNLQMRNLERLGSTMFLGLVMIGGLDGRPLEPLKQNDIMQGLLEILRKNLRKGDTITQFSPTLFALLLPTVSYQTGNMVMERVKRFFYRKYPNSNVLFNSRVGPLSSDGRYDKE
ncbi:MAG: BTAD domain-containing putative transcriptional regulator [Clostridia bacterium]